MRSSKPDDVALLDLVAVSHGAGEQVNLTLVAGVAGGVGVDESDHVEISAAVLPSFLSYSTLPSFSFLLDKVATFVFIKMPFTFKRKMFSIICIN